MIRTLRSLALLAILSAIPLGLCACSGPTKAGLDARKETNERFNAPRANLAAQQARQAFDVGNLKEALAQIDGAVMLQPTNPDHLVMRGRILIEMQRLGEAEEAFKGALALKADHGDANYYSGVVHQRWSNFDDALGRYQAAYASDDSNLAYLLAVIETQISLRQLEEAWSTAQASLARFENDSQLHQAMGHIALLQSKPEVAVEQFRRALILSPDDPNIGFNLANACLQARQYDKAEQAVDRLLQNATGDLRLDLLHIKARCLSATNRLVEARFAYLDLTQADPSNVEAWYELGIVAYQLGDTRRFAEVVNTTTSRWPQRYEGYVLQGMLFEARNDYQTAEQSYTAACRLSDNSSDAVVLLARNLMNQGEHARAQELLETLLTREPENQQAQSLRDSLTKLTSAPDGQ